MQMQTESIRFFVEACKKRYGDLPGQAPVLCYLEETDSTNEWAKRDMAAGLLPWQKAGTDRGKERFAVYLADHQTAGKGRRGRVWKSPAGTSVSMSLLLCPQTAPENYSMLTLVMGLSAAEGIRDVSGLDVGIKWPNDVVCDGRKLCGILTELCQDGKHVVIGIGLNINVTEFPEELRDTAASIQMLTGHPASREEVTAAVICRFRQCYDLFLKHENLHGLRERYESMLVNRNQQVRVLDPRAPYEGIAAGIDDRGELLVRRLDTGELVHVYAGEVSVRGIYGYV